MSCNPNIFFSNPYHRVSLFWFALFLLLLLIFILSTTVSYSNSLKQLFIQLHFRYSTICSLLEMLGGILWSPGATGTSCFIISLLCSHPWIFFEPFSRRFFSLTLCCMPCILCIGLLFGFVGAYASVAPKHKQIEDKLISVCHISFMSWLNIEFQVENHFIWETQRNYSIIS